jgi:hypothetical protein
MILAAAIHLASALRYAGDEHVAAELDPERRRELLEERRRRQSAGEGDEARE